MGKREKKEKKKGKRKKIERVGMNKDKWSERRKNELGINH